MMRLITGLSAQNFQKFQTTIEDGTIVYFHLYFKPRVSFWFIDVINGTHTIYGLKLCSVPNVLQQWSNIFKFGVFISVDDGTEPLLINDFYTGRVNFYVLNQEEVNLISEAYTL